MTTIVQSPQPKIQFISHKTNTCYQTFSIGSKDVSGKNLQSYTFEKSLKDFSGSFNITIKEDTTQYSNLFLDKVQPLDIVKIYEDGKTVDFIGLVTTKSFGATAGNANKIISITGKSIEYLFEMYMISGDSTAMSFFNADVSNLDLITQLNSSGNKEISVQDGVRTAFESFVKITNSYPGISSYKMKDLITKYFGSSPNVWAKTHNLKFKFPITNNMFSNSTIKFIDFMRTLLPEEVYEIFCRLENGNPVIEFREVPFDNAAFSKLPLTTLKPSWITDYSFTLSNNEVYTAFMAYIENSPFSEDFLKKAAANVNNGYGGTDTIPEKVALYGYRPKYVHFIGFGIQDDERKQQSVTNQLENEFTKLNERIKNWYGRLDEMWNGDITVVNILDSIIKMPKVGERVKICNGTFYVTAEKHSWRYGSDPTINYTVERGGQYSVSGEFKSLSGLSKPLGELIHLW